MNLSAMSYEGGTFHDNPFLDHGMQLLVHAEAQNIIMEPMPHIQRQLL